MNSQRFPFWFLRFPENSQWFPFWFPRFPHFPHCFRVSWPALLPRFAGFYGFHSVHIASVSFAGLHSSRASHTIEKPPCSGKGCARILNTERESIENPAPLLRFAPHKDTTTARTRLSQHINPRKRILHPSSAPREEAARTGTESRIVSNRESPSKACQHSTPSWKNEVRPPRPPIQC